MENPNHNPETVQLLEDLKSLWGIKKDKDLAKRLNMIPQDIISLKRYSLSKFTKGIVHELLQKK